MTGRIDLLSLLVILLNSATKASAFSAPNNSPWKSASWRLVLDIGRENPSNLPEEWGRSGARLSFPLELLVESERLPEEQQDPLLGRGANRLRVVDEASITYITEQGEQRVPIQCNTGGWKLRLGRTKGHASLLRFWLDIGSAGFGKKVAAQKKDVTLLANERLYFAAHCWREEDWKIGRRKIQPLAEAYERAQAKLEEKVDHEGGDRRLDGDDPLETLAAYKDMAGLTLDRDDKRRQLLDAQEYLPPPQDIPLGNWPGSTELVALRPMEIFVKRKQGLIPKEDYHLVGSWEARPLNVIPQFEEEEYEYYDDDEEEGEEMEDDQEYEYYEDDDEEALDDGEEAGGGNEDSETADEKESKDKAEEAMIDFSTIEEPSPMIDRSAVESKSSSNP